MRTSIALDLKARIDEEALFRYAVLRVDETVERVKTVEGYMEMSEARTYPMEIVDAVTTISYKL